MSQFEYKTVLLPYKPSTFQDDATDVGASLNKEAANGWRVLQIVIPSTLWGRANGMIAILERTKA
jgi:hypothetical protein